jgi:hypothetical protein
LEEVVVVWEREGVPVVQDLRGCHNGRFVEASIVVVVKGLLLQGCCRAALKRGSEELLHTGRILGARCWR